MIFRSVYSQVIPRYCLVCWICPSVIPRTRRVASQFVAEQPRDVYVTPGHLQPFGLTSHGALYPFDFSTCIPFGPMPRSLCFRMARKSIRARGWMKSSEGARLFINSSQDYFELIPKRQIVELTAWISSQHPGLRHHHRIDL